MALGKYSLVGISVPPTIPTTTFKPPSIEIVVTVTSILTSLIKNNLDLSDEIRGILLDALPSILNMKYNNGQLVLRIDKQDVIFEVVSMLIANPSRESIQNLINYFASQSPSTALWNTPQLESARKEFDLDIKILKEPEVGITGVAICLRCFKDNIAFDQRQTRSNDEAMTVKYTCLDCGNKWSG